IALRGAARAKATFLNLQVLKSLGIPFFVLLDNVRAELVRRGELPQGASEEERIAADLIRLAQEEGVSLTIKGLRYPDVLCTLPPAAVRRAAEQSGGNSGAFTGWEELLAAHALANASLPDGAKRQDLKQFLLATLGLTGRISIDEFLARTLAA